MRPQPFATSTRVLSPISDGSVPFFGASGCFTSPTPRQCGDDDHQVCLRTPLQEMGSRGAAALSSRLASVYLLAR